MNLEKQEIINKLNERIKSVDNVRALHEIKNIFSKEFIKPLFQQLSTLENADEKRNFGQNLQNIQKQVDQIIELKKNEIELEKDRQEKPDYDVMLPANTLLSGTNHVLQLMIDKINSFFKQFNFKIFNGNELTTTQLCFDFLNIPDDHPGRSVRDTFYINDKNLLRTQCTASTLQAAIHLNKLRDIRVLSFGNVYRNDTDDATHSHQFTQVDFMWIREKMSLANLKWFMQHFINFIFSENVKTRFRLSHFPFTEPSFEVDVRCWNCKNGCSICKNSRWIEILGSGLLHHNVLRAIGVSPKMSGLAAGIGIERLVMIKHGINDIRNLYDNDFRFNDQFEE